MKLSKLIKRLQKAQTRFNDDPEVHILTPDKGWSKKSDFAKVSDVDLIPCGDTGEEVENAFCVILSRGDRATELER